MNRRMAVVAVLILGAVGLWALTPRRGAASPPPVPSAPSEMRVTRAAQEELPSAPSAEAPEEHPAQAAPSIAPENEPLLPAVEPAVSISCPESPPRDRSPCRLETEGDVACSYGTGPDAVTCRCSSRPDAPGTWQCGARETVPLAACPTDEPSLGAACSPNSLKCFYHRTDGYRQCVCNAGAWACGRPDYGK